MTIQPIFTVESIKERCKNDIETFLENNNIKNTTGLEINDIDSYDNMKEQMDKIMNFINPTFINPTNDTTYVKMFHNPIDKERQQQLFIARTILFYQLLQYLVKTFENIDLYNETYTDKDKWIFRYDVSKSMSDFKMGIFGSMKPTSDIDLGIQYTGDYTNCKPALSYFVSRFEKLFLLFTNQTSLDFNIETYADMTTIPNQNIEEKEHPDVFYLSTSEINEEQYKRIVKCAKYSIARNYLLAVKELHETETNPKIITLGNIKDSLTAIVSVEKLNTIFNMNDSFEDEISYMNDFFNMSYEEQIKEYYIKVDDAEILKAFHGEKIYHLNAEQITELIFKIGLANTYRMESYCCIPTITHVVRILQQESQNNLKYPTLAPSSIEDMCSKNHDIIHIPICTIGSYGYMLSLLEQLGYLYRFYLTYCEKIDGHGDKCENKMKKYSERYINALIYINVNKKGDSSKSIRRRSITRRSIRRRRTTKRIKMTTKGLIRKSSRRHRK